MLPACPNCFSWRSKIVLWLWCYRCSVLWLITTLGCNWRRCHFFLRPRHFFKIQDTSLQTKIFHFRQFPKFSLMCLGYGLTLVHNNVQVYVFRIVYWLDWSSNRQAVTEIFFYVSVAKATDDNFNFSKLLSGQIRTVKIKPFLTRLIVPEE